jgi:RNA ligase (TIGR02306 family)
MSSLIVEVSRIDKVLPHPNAEKLELGIVKGWQLVIPKGKYAAGDRIVYIPIDSVLPIELSDRLGITKYLSHGRVRCAKLRGEPSFGVVMDVESDWPDGTDVAAHYGITKYVPPIRTSIGDAAPNHPLFVSYTEIENMRNFPEVIRPGEEIVLSEKIHGTNCRIGLIDADGTATWMAGSKGMRRAQPPDEQMASNLYWHPYTVAGVADLIRSVFNEGRRQVILFGEVYGRVQSLRYGLPGEIAFRAFDLLVDGRYIDFDRFQSLCAQFGVQTVPVLYRGPFDLETVKKLAEGRSTLPGADHIREGVVARPVIERQDPKVGRVILKYIGDGYLFGDVPDTEDV